MKTSRAIPVAFLILLGLQYGLSGCFTDGAVGVGVDTGVYYGRYRDPWFRDDRWIDGHRWRGDDRYRQGGASPEIYIHPPRILLPPVIRIR